MLEGLRASFGIPLLLLPPGVVIASLAGRGLRRVERFFLGWAVAPLALGLPALLFAWPLHHPLGAALGQTEFVYVVLAIWLRTRPAAERTAPAAAADVAPADSTDHPARYLPMLAIGAAALTAIPPLVNPFIRMWSDAWFHAAAAIEIQLRGMPPQDPNFAGIPLYYPWFFHTLLAFFDETLRVSPFHAQAMLNVWSAGLLVLTAGLLSARLPGSPPAWVSGCVVLFGLDPLGWMHWIGAAMIGATRGWAALVAGLQGPGRVGDALNFNFPPSHVSLLDRVWTGTALTPAIALALALVWCVDDALRRPRAGAALRVLLVAATMEALHPAFATLSIALFVAGLAVVAAGAARRAPIVLAALALTAAVAVAVPYVRFCSLPDETTPVRLGWYTRNAWSLAVSIGPWWIPALIAMPAAWRAGGGIRALVVAMTGALGLALFVVLPERNTDKFFYLVWVLVAPLAVAGAWRWARDRRVPPRLAAACLVAATLPSSAIFTAGFLLESRSPGVLVRGSTPETAALPLMTRGEAAAYRYLAEDTPVRAIVLDGRRPTVNEPVPVLAGRRVFCGSPDVYLTNHFGSTFPPGSRAGALIEEVGVRRGIETRLRAPAPLDDVQRAYLDTFRDPLILMVRRAEVADSVWDARWSSSGWSLEFQDPEVRLYRYRGTPVVSAAA